MRHRSDRVAGRPPSPGSSPVAAAAGGLAACCAVHLLVLAGVVGSLSGLAVGGIAVGAGVAVATAVWLAALLLRRRAQNRRSPKQPTGYKGAYDDRIYPYREPGA